MNLDRFNDILRKRLRHITEVLDKKAGEYATADRLHNFRAAAALSGFSMAEACTGFMLKHWVSVQDLCSAARDGRRDFVRQHLDEKIGDAVNYLILLEAILLEMTDD